MDILYCDSHAHLCSVQLHGDLDGILLRAREVSIRAIVNICTDVDTLQKGLQLHARYPWVYNAAATTPHDVAKEGEAVFPIIADCARRQQLVAVGETGLDYHYYHSPPEMQQDFLRRYLHLALECHLPVIIHCREAFADFFEILDADYCQQGRHAPGVLHCFTGTVAEAEQVLARGWYLSLSGIVTFKKSQELREVAKLVPLHQLLVETDAPYLAPQRHRGKLNEPSYMTEVVEVIAEVKGLSPAEVASATLGNSCKLFNLELPS